MKRHFLSALLVSMSFLVLAQAPALAQDKPAKPASGETAKPEAPVAAPLGVKAAAIERRRQFQYWCRLSNCFGCGSQQSPAS